MISQPQQERIELFRQINLAKTLLDLIAPYYQRNSIKAHEQLIGNAFKILVPCVNDGKHSCFTSPKE